MYMSYRWRESFNTVRSPSDSWRHHNGDWRVGAECGKEEGGGWTIHPSRRWLISCAWAAVLYVCLSIALASCTTSMAETNLDAIRKQKNAEYSKTSIETENANATASAHNFRSRTRKITSIVSALWYKHRIMYMSYRGFIRVTRICRQKI